MAGPHHRDPSYVRMAALIRAAANADANYQCPTCGLTLTERQRTHPGATWDCDHITPGSLGAGLRARCSTCNRGDGARIVNGRRASGYGW